ncbi:MAG: LPS assembly lipoprotein LptE [Gammaproteobacteria bacterium]|nr:LPS assembly lipoprotein LptE [Gammaproteobacteria bacterium]
MNIRKSIFTALIFIVSPAFAAEINVDYNYAGNHNTDFSNLRVSLAVAEVTDDRGSEANHIAEDYTANVPLTEIIQDALIQGFEHGGAELADGDAEMQIAGRIISSQLQTVDRGGVESLQLTIRTNVALQGNGRTIWETTLFGRGTVPVDDGITTAIYAALDRMIRELVNDDYFLIEIQ